MTLKITRTCENPEPRLCLSGELRCANVVDLRVEIGQVGQSVVLDLDEVDVVDIDGIRFLNECRARGIEVANCSPYIRKWMLLERHVRRDEK